MGYESSNRNSLLKHMISLLENKVATGETNDSGGFHYHHIYRAATLAS